ncbi:zinc finger CCCH domain-containing protein 6-like isoform X3 [Primulina tabacum]|uniref:zinc finger CCCH domain-containing protein 6-like isoform X3 n=1 Tax=Primulina tabacum TaxID=48773 RepID=UPI003F59F458
MRRSQKSKRVAWASDGNLYQVRLFCSEESPALVGLRTQNHLQAKALWPLQSTGTGLDDSLPPGFEGNEPAKLWRIKLSQIPLITWRCPPSFEVNSSWRVVAGEESIEIEAQKRREMTMLEAIYPRSSTIPPNPSVSAGADDSVINDQTTPLVPITPVEDEDIALDTTFGSIARNTDSADDKRVAPGVEPDTVLAAQVALSLITSKSYQGNLIDRELLIKILSDPKMTMPAIGVHTISSTSMPNLMSLPKNLFNPVSIAVNRRDPEPITPSKSTSNLPLYPPCRNPRPSVPDVTPVPSPEVPKVKDINYYKSLIQQHGEERMEILPRYSHQTNEVQLGISQERSKIAKSRDSKQKMMKPCIFFNSSRGCRNGVNCAYQHGSAAQQKVIGIQEVQGAKRAKIHR